MYIFIFYFWKIPKVCILFRFQNEFLGITLCSRAFLIGRNCLWVRYKVTVFPRPKKIKLRFLKVTVSVSYRFYVVESYRCSKVTVFIGRKLPFVDKVTVISKSYRFSAESNHFFITLPFLDKKFTTSWKQRTLWSSLV